MPWSRSFKRYCLLGAGTSIISVWLAAHLFTRSYVTQYAESVGTSGNLTSSYLHLLVPASESNANLCKTLYSASILDYPTPHLYNFGSRFENAELLFGGSHLAKINGSLTYLRRLDPSHHEDMAVLIDGYDIWFQLRPSVLLERYLAINLRANARIRKRLGASVTESQKIGQSVVFSAQKRCWPAGPDDPACYAVPPSELPSQIYGPETDTANEDEKNPYVRYRQRYLNSGFIMGPVGKLLAIFERAFEKAQFNPGMGSDQAIFADIFGEQEHAREVLRVANSNSGAKSIISTNVDVDDPRNDVLNENLFPTYKHPENNEPADREFGIGLDYRGELSQPTVFSEDDLAWVVRDPPSLSQSAMDHVTPDQYPLPADIERSTPPFWTFDREVAVAKVPEDKQWDNVPLYTNLYTGQSPVAIHHNAHRDGLKSRIQTFWNETWFTPHIRELLIDKWYSTRMPAAVLSSATMRDILHHNDKSIPQTSAGAQEWWGPIDERNGVRVESGHLLGDWKTWDELCGTDEISTEIFRDHKGALKGPLVMLDSDGGIANKQMDDWRASQPQRQGQEQ